MNGALHPHHPMRLLTLLLLILWCATPATAASVKISDLTPITSPSTNTWIEVADLDATVPKSRKFLFSPLLSSSGSVLTPATIMATNLSTGNQVIYTTPANTRFAVHTTIFRYPGTLSNMNCFCSRGGTNYQLRQTITTQGTTAGVGTPPFGGQPPVFVLEPGDQYIVTSDVGGYSAWLVGYTFTNTLSYFTRIVPSTTTPALIYQCPTNKIAVPGMNGRGTGGSSIHGFRVSYYNGTSAAHTLTNYFVPSGLFLNETMVFSAGSNVNTNTVGTANAQVLFNPGDAIWGCSDSNDANQFYYLTVLEVDP